MPGLWFWLGVLAVCAVFTIFLWWLAPKRKVRYPLSKEPTQFGDMHHLPILPVEGLPLGELRPSSQLPLEGVTNRRCFRHR